MPKSSDFIGRRFNSWTIVKSINNRIAECICVCGNIGRVAIYDLVSGRSKRCNDCAKKFRGLRSHSMSRTRIYKIWKGIKRRCNSPNSKHYENYGGRGIKMCEEWKDFVSFYQWALSNGYNDNLSIDRKNFNGDYEPDNCRWATRLIQNNNTRRNHYIEYHDGKYTMSQLANMYGLDPLVFYKRIKRGWSVDAALHIKLNGRVRDYEKLRYNTQN